MVYKGTAGAPAQAPETWPMNATLIPSSSRPTVVMLAHPKCPCTRASLGELESLVAKAKDKFDAAVVFYEPDDAPGDWSNTDLVKTARAIPGVRVILDDNGKLTRRFGAKTSGHTLVYATGGKLSFSGGITGARGHFGDNAGLDAALNAVENGRGDTRSTRATVFGCNLFEACKEKQSAANN
jgi:hypothetical protein